MVWCGDWWLKYWKSLKHFKKWRFLSYLCLSKKSSLKEQKEKNSIKLLHEVKWGVVNECVGMRSGLHKPLSQYSIFVTENLRSCDFCRAEFSIQLGINYFIVFAHSSRGSERERVGTLVWLLSHKNIF